MDKGIMVAAEQANDRLFKSAALKSSNRNFAQAKPNPGIAPPRIYREHRGIAGCAVAFAFH